MITNSRILQFNQITKFPILNQFNQSRCMANHRHKKMVKLAKGYRGRANRCFTVAKQRVEKAMQYAYKGRKVHIYSL